MNQQEPAGRTIDLRAVTTRDRLMDALRAGLEFPSWTGRNWDAVHDTITGIVEMPRRLTLLGWTRVAEALPRDARILREILDDFARGENAAGRPMTVEYRDEVTDRRD
ncbi:barstar family protein [Mangrovihabitans endophyticus]|uniref:Barstar (barnase inhibitor) domain-containing protein n=1 Tax=Mangrovihabitans endophyticus TaxID=1751298 RepID=A0A8J3BTS5_9ACTN|nr:barstar family protein [Mangrovihabitans endophyticus]GGK76448.1 hypothetical protein GCM10012284_07970 [Mangrovihabitans endophyticus]